MIDTYLNNICEFPLINHSYHDCIDHGVSVSVGVGGRSGGKCCSNRFVGNSGVGVGGKSGSGGLGVGGKSGVGGVGVGGQRAKSVRFDDVDNGGSILGRDDSVDRAADKVEIH